MPRQLDDQATASLIHRIERVQESQAPLWGKMNATQMMAHCSTALKLAFGDVPSKIIFPPWKASVARWLFIDMFPLPKNSPTAAELHPQKKMKASADFLAEREELIRQLKRMNAAGPDQAFAPHPLFRKLGRKQYGKLIYKHLDHHLRQFGA
jgi:hypothetical protein